MSDLDLSVFVEFGVGLAGFSGVVVAFAQRSGRLGDYDRFRVIQLLMGALIPAFLGLLPVILASFGIKGEETWRIAGIAFIVSLLANSGAAIVYARRMSPKARRSLSPVIWLISLGGGVFFLIWNALNLMGWPRPVSFGPVVAGMTWLLAMASLMFFRLLLVRLGDEPKA